MALLNHYEIEKKNPLKQGLKHGEKGCFASNSYLIEKKNPLKQGLKQDDDWHSQKYKNH